MKRTAICLCISVTIGGWAAGVMAADTGDKKGAKPAAASATKDDTGAAPAGAADTDTGAGAGATGAEPTEPTTTEPGEATPTPEAAKTAATLSWQDIVVVPRKPVLKGGRFELAPFTGVSVNDILIRHYVFGADLNYFLTDVFWVGLQGNYYLKNLTDREELVGLQFNRVPALNRYIWGAGLNFGYVPVYGKFALFNKRIVHWEIFASAGFGITKTEIIPVVPGDAVFQTNALTPNFALGGRFFVLNWLTINWALRDYLLVDKYEPINRHNMYVSAASAQAHADSQIVNNVMFYVGAGFFLPTKFQYKTPR